MDKVKLVKLNQDYQSDPNTASPSFSLHNSELELRFALNYFTFDFEEDAVGRIIFKSCEAFRAGSPNDEGFSHYHDNELWNSDNFKNLEWDSFYEVIDAPSDYSKHFYMTANFEEKREELHHYVFFTKEATFECFAEAYEEKLPLKKNPHKEDKAIKIKGGDITI